MKNSSSYVSEDIIFAEIIPRLLSIKSLLKFSCVSKSWFSFISSKKFAKTQLQKSVNTNVISLCHGFDKQCVINQCHFSSLLSDSTESSVQYQLGYLIDTDRFTSRVIGFSNGLCCILVDGIHFILFNPFTRKSHELPHVFNKDICGCSNSNAQGFGNNHDCEARVLIKDLFVRMDGFGYDETKDDYIVFAILRITRVDQLKSYSILRLYSLNTNSWKTVEFSLSHIAADTTGVFLNGNLHWPTTWTSGYLHLKPLSFDLRSGTFGLVEQPSSVNVQHIYATIDVLQGCLCMLCDDPEGTQVWVMKEYGVKESWRRLVTVPYHCIPNHFPYRTFKVIYISEDGDFMLHHGQSLFIYNPKTKSIRSAFKRPESYMINGISICVESLVSPFPDGEGEKLN